MTYSDFLSSLGSVISSFIAWLSSMANIVSSNYILITLLGLSLFGFVFYFFVDLLLSFRESKSNFDDVGDHK